MASTIAAITTGVGGVVTTADATGNLSLLSGTTTVVAVTATGASVTGTLAVSGVTTLTGGLNAALPVLSGGTGVTTSTGSGNNVLSTSPNLTTPVLGTVTSGNISACTSTNMVLVTPTFNSASLATISGTAPLYMCRAWVNYKGTVTRGINASGNVSSVTFNSTGDYTVNFTTAMVDANYAVVGGVDDGASSDRWLTFYSLSTTSVRMANKNSAAGSYDSQGIMIQVVR